MPLAISIEVLARIQPQLIFIPSYSSRTTRARAPVASVAHAARRGYCLCSRLVPVLLWRAGYGRHHVRTGNSGTIDYTIDYEIKMKGVDSRTVASDDSLFVSTLSTEEKAKNTLS
eukprot:scaffold28009_cov55-Phaeocystis_antarctica.AAC.4